MFTTNECIACESKQGEGNVSLFRFPRNSIRCRQWIERTGITQLYNVPSSEIYEKCRLCSLHFETSQFRPPRSKEDQHMKLIPNALPTLFNGVNNGRKRSRPRKGCSKSNKSLQVLASCLCRLCATVSDDLIEVFGEEARRLDLIDKIHTHLPIMVTEHDILPTSCCSSCISKLELCHNFAASCLDANSKLYTILQLPKPLDNETADSLLVPEQNSESNEKGIVHQFHCTFQGLEANESIPWKTSEYNLFGDDGNVENQIVNAIWNSGENADETTDIEEKTVNEVPVYRRYTSKNGEKQDSQKDLSITLSSGVPLREKQKNSIQFQEINAEAADDDFLLPKITKTESLAFCGKGTRFGNWNLRGGVNKTSSTKCNICKFQFINTRRLRSHISAVHKNLHFKCQNCGKRFSQQSNLRRHIAVHRMTYTCKICFESLPTYQLMLSHRLLHISSGINMVIDSECDPVSVPTVSYSKNINSCDLLSQTRTIEFRSGPTVSTDILVDTESEENLGGPVSLIRPTDDAANIEFSNSKGKATDGTVIEMPGYSEMTGIEKPVVEGPLINMVTSLSHNNIELRKHIIQEPEIAVAVNSINGDNVSHQSQLCQVEYDQRYVNVKDAKEIVTFLNSEPSNNSNEFFHCSTCNKIFTSELACVNHMSKHPVEKKFICAMCNRPFAHQWALDSHLRIHSDEKPFTCRFCEAKFLYKRSLVVHERDHTENKEFKCTFCERHFSSGAKLKQHMITHSNNWPFKCSLCPREFRRKDALKYHLSKHRENCKLWYHVPDEKKNEGSDTQGVSSLETEEVKLENCVIFREFGASEVVIESHPDDVPILHDSNVACEYVI